MLFQEIFTTAQEVQIRRAQVTHWGTSVAGERLPPNRDPKQKYLDDAVVLQRAFVGEPDNARYVFYLARSYRPAGQTLELRR